MRTEDNYVSPLRWVRALGDANILDSGSNSSVWHDVGMMAKNRSGDIGIENDWPGFVYIPSFLIEKSLLSREMLIPYEWAGMRIEILSRLISTLSAWNVERKVLSFTPLAKKVIKNSHVDIELTSRSFSGLPGLAIYISMPDILGNPSVSMQGMFVSLNIRQNRTSELVMILDYGSSLEIKAVPLNGKTPDELFNEVQKNLSRARDRRQQNNSNLELHDELAEFGGNFHATLAAILITCISRPRIISSKINADVLDGYSPIMVAHLESGDSLLDSFDGSNVVLDRILLQSQAMVANWRSSSAQNPIHLKCSTMNATTLKLLSEIAK